MTRAGYDRPLVGALLLCATLAVFTPAPAAAERFALAIGNNLGDQGEEALRWAEDDARKTHALLTELGDVAPENAQLVLGGGPAEVRAAVAQLRGRIAQAKRPSETVLFAYYSGHGSARDLHLTGSRLPLRELDQLLAAAHATTLITIVDACRDQPSDVRTKGATHADPFEIRLEHEAGPSGRVTITSAGRNEVAQESDKLRGSFFTHHLLIGMRGAADRDGDRQVSLDELYRYAYHHTLVSSHAHLAAVQHPQLDVELQGEGDLVVTRLSRADALLTLAAPLAGDVMVVDADSGQVVAQLFKAEGSLGRLALPAGRFRVQLRRDDAIYSGEVGLEWGGSTTLEPSALVRRAFERSANKGGARMPLRIVLFAGARVGTAVAGDATSSGGALRVGLELPRVRLALETAFGFAHGENPLQARDYFETRVGLAAGPRMSFAPLSLWLGLGAGALWLHERSTRIAQDQAVESLGLAEHGQADAVGPYLAPQLALELALGGDFMLSASGELQLALIALDERVRLRSGPAALLAVGKRF
jgi:hypothetical protein